MFIDSPTYEKAFRDYLRRGTAIDFSIKAGQPAQSGWYIWRTQGDDKVRASHAANDGQIFEWANPPATGHPGEKYNCRCRAEPYRAESPRDLPQTASMLSVSRKGVEFIANYEKLKLKVYLDQAGYPTIGYGHKLLPHERYPQGITKEQALQIFARDLRTAERPVAQHVKVKITQNQFDALVSVAFNAGGGAFSRSKLLQHLNQLNYEGVLKEFLDWNKVRENGAFIISQGLIDRRANEIALFFGHPM